MIMKSRIAFAGAVVMALVMCSNKDSGTPDAGDAGAQCETHASAACGAPGGDYYMTTLPGCTGTTCPNGDDICLSSNDQLTCVSLAAVCAGQAGVVQAILACKSNSDCPARMICGNPNTCVPNCTPDAG
jgi:hypothetical protein